MTFVQEMVFVAKERLTRHFSVQDSRWRIKCCKENIPKECVQFTKKLSSMDDKNLRRQGAFT